MLIIVFLSNFFSVMPPLSLKTVRATWVALTLSSQNLPIYRTRELFKPSTYSGSLLVSTFENWEVLDFVFCERRHNSWWVFTYLTKVDGPWRQHNEPIFCLKIFLEIIIVCNPSLKSPWWLSSISGAKIMTQKQHFWFSIKSNKMYTWPIWANAITFQPIELESCSNPQKTRKVFYFGIKNVSFRFEVLCGWHNI